jgi:peptidoglycan L-alanyl-D-glutamate endopeptidase CwlK
MPSTALRDCDPILAEAYTLGKAMYEEANPGYTMIVTCTHRSVEEQFELYKKGREFRDGVWVLDRNPITGIVTQIDGFKEQSKHNGLPSKALDFALVFQGKVVWNERGEFAEAASFFKRLGVAWGGDWPRFKDYPHLEIE